METRTRTALRRSSAAAVVMGVTLLASTVVPTTGFAATPPADSGSAGGNSDTAQATAPGLNKTGDDNAATGKGEDNAQGVAGGQDADHNPPGNNGTAKIHDVANDHTTRDVPHVSCTSWYVDLFGFDSNQQGQIIFTGQAPTGKDVALYDSGVVTISPDDAGGAANDWDSEWAFTGVQGGNGTFVDLSQLGAPQPQQGYHITLTLNTFQPGDNGVKHKEFWVDNCPAGGSGGGGGGGELGGGGGDTGGGSGGSGGGGGSGGSGGSGGGGGGSLATGGSGGRTAGSGTQVLGESFHRAPTGATGGATAGAGTEVIGNSTARQLPFTGAPTGKLLASGLSALFLGIGMMMVGRRRVGPQA